MAKGKKGKKGGDPKKVMLAAKKLKQEKKAERSKNKANKDDDSDADDVDVETVLAEYKKEQELFLKVTETVLEAPPSARASSTFLANPANDNQLLMFGGDHYDGKFAKSFNDLLIYFIDRDEWRLVTSPNTPLPRSAHAWCRGGNQKDVWLFGGEFSSPKLGSFYHYNDLWRLDPVSREWTRIEVKGKSPSARSGHRMVGYVSEISCPDGRNGPCRYRKLMTRGLGSFKQYIILFGGFQDTSHNTHYLADLWLFDTVNYVWHNPTLPPGQQKPEARSSYSFLPHEQGAVLWGGYSKVRTTVAANKQAKAGAQGQRTVIRAKVHQDCFFLRVTPSTDATAPTVRWEKRKLTANAPKPARAGATMVYHRGRGILFGGVKDVETSDDDLDSEFFNQMFAYNIERNRFFPLTLRKPRQQSQKKAAGGEGGAQRRKGRAQANEQELLRTLAALQAGQSVEDADAMELDPEDETPPFENEWKPAGEKEVITKFPNPRFHAQLAVQKDVLYIYGGTFENSRQEFYLDDMYAVDLGKMDGCKVIFARLLDVWDPAACKDYEGSEDEDDEDEDGDDEDDDDEDDDEDDEDEDDEDGGVAMGDAKPAHFTPSTRKTKRLVHAVQDGSVVEGPSANTESTTPSTVDPEEDETEPDSITTVDDGLPHPRPFESRRDFFQRTSNEWQEILMTSLRWKGVQPETLTVKEIKTKAFDLSEEKWWDCREEITILEEQQEAAGIGEVISLRDKENADGAGGPRRR